MSTWDSCGEGDLCNEGFVCDDDSYGHCEERFPTVFWVFQFSFIALFMAQCVWACCDHKKKTNEKIKPVPRSTTTAKPQPIPQQTPLPQTPNTADHKNNNQLPNGWIQCYTSEGKLYYQNSETKTTQWEKPQQPLPDGWVVITTPDGKTYYQNNLTKETQWNRPTNNHVIVTPPETFPDVAHTATNTTTTTTDVNTGFDWDSFDYKFGAFLEFPFSTTCRNYLIRLLCCFATMAAFLFAYLLPSCCPEFYDSSYLSPDCCSWYGTNYFIYIFSWILFVWYCLSGLYLVVIKKQEMTWISSSSYQTGNTEVTTTTVTSSSNVAYNICMLLLQAGILCFAMVILPAIMGGDCQNYYC